MIYTTNINITNEQVPKYSLPFKYDTHYCKVWIHYFQEEKMHNYQDLLFISKAVIRHLNSALMYKENILKLNFLSY